jgi:predicted amidophosphoribosyltransferase
MQYYLCPRCRFKTASNKPVCQTCGLNFAVYNSTISSDSSAVEVKPSKFKAFAKFLNLEGRAKKSGREKPALS